MRIAGTPTVLIVEDDPELRTFYSQYLNQSAEYSIYTAASAQDAFEQIDETVDVVLLDRRMPGMEGEEVLYWIREQGFDCRVAMVTAVDPDFDIIEMGFDDYVIKPVSRDELVATVETLLDQADYEDIVQEYFSLVSKITALEAEKPDTELEASDEYDALLTRLSEIKADARAALNNAMENGEFESIVQNL